MLDLKFVRDNPHAVISELGRKGMTHAEASVLINTLVDLDQQHRKAIQNSESLLQQRNEESARIPTLQGIERQRAIESMTALKGFLSDSTANERKLHEQVQETLLRIPNMLDVGVPIGVDESHNKVISDFPLLRPNFSFTPKDHVTLGENLGMMDFEAAAEMSGARFCVTKGPLARLERALGQFMLDRHAMNGFMEVNPPLMVHANALIGTGQLPKFKDDLFHIPESDHWLIPTAEVSITNLVRDKIIPEDQLPLRYVALTPCFRAEAGSAGRDTRGLIRQHQFYKVELVSITDSATANEHNFILINAQGILGALELSFRTVLLCGGDTGFSAAKTIDIEVWIPSQETYREISSVSDFGQFQSRRMNARYKPSDGGKNRYLRTFNGSGLAVGRTLVAVMENYQNEDGSIRVPRVLQPYMNGLEVIR
jgi:seryl-tRNA synthetase